MGAQDCNILIMLEYPNMAALDGLRDKMDPIVEKIMGSEDQRRATAVKRLDIREILGTTTMREITVKGSLFCRGTPGACTTSIIAADTAVTTGSTATRRDRRCRR